MVQTRDIDKIEALPDAQLKKQDADYLERHKLDQTFAEALSNLITLQPPEPVQYLIDMVQYGADQAKQDPVTGLSAHRRAKLMDVFRFIDKEGIGRISFRALQAYVTSNGGSSLSTDDMRSIFSDFNPATDQLITPTEFLAFWSKVFRALPNKQFDALVQNMMAL